MANSPSVGVTAAPPRRLPASASLTPTEPTESVQASPYSPQILPRYGIGNGRRLRAHQPPQCNSTPPTV